MQELVNTYGDRLLRSAFALCGNEADAQYDEELTGREVSHPDENLSQLDAAAASSALLEALQKLSRTHREVIVLRYYEAMKIHEIARHLRISKGTVKSRLHYAIAEMQKLLPDELNLFGTRGTEEIGQR